MASSRPPSLPRSLRRVLPWRPRHLFWFWTTTPTNSRPRNVKDFSRAVTGITPLPAHRPHCLQTLVDLLLGERTHETLSEDALGRGRGYDGVPGRGRARRGAGR